MTLGNFLAGIAGILIACAIAYFHRDLRPRENGDLIWDEEKKRFIQDDSEYQEYKNRKFGQDEQK